MAAREEGELRVHGVGSARWGLARHGDGGRGLDQRLNEQRQLLALAPRRHHVQRQRAVLRRQRGLLRATGRPAGGPERERASSAEARGDASPTRSEPVASAQQAARGRRAGGSAGLTAVGLCRSSMRTHGSAGRAVCSSATWIGVWPSSSRTSSASGCASVRRAVPRRSATRPASPAPPPPPPARMRDALRELRVRKGACARAHVVRKARSSGRALSSTAQGDAGQGALPLAAETEYGGERTQAPRARERMLAARAGMHGRGGWGRTCGLASSSTRTTSAGRATARVTVSQRSARVTVSQRSATAATLSHEQLLV